MLQSLVGVEVLLSNKKAAKVLYINKNVIEKPIVQYVDNSEIIDLNNHFPLSILSLASIREILSNLILFQTKILHPAQSFYSSKVVLPAPFVPTIPILSPE